MARLIEDVRRRFPGLARRADEGQRLPAVRLFCIECSGGSLGEARKCPARECPLWNAAGGAWSRTREAACAHLGGLGGAGKREIAVPVVPRDLPAPIATN